MIRWILRIAAGSALLWWAISTMLSTTQEVKDIISPPVSTAPTSKLPVRASKRAEDNQDKIERAEQMNQIAEIVAVLGAGLTLYGAVPLLLWALFGRTNRPDPADCTQPQPSIAVTTAKVNTNA